MHRGSILLLSLVLCAQHVFAVREMSGSAGKSLLQAVATVSGSLTVDEPGTVSVAASSVAREFSAAEARNLLISAVANAVAEIESGGAAISLAESVAQSYAMAVADAFIQAVSVELSSTGGGGDACGQATIPSDNAASTVVRDLVEVLSAASDLIAFVNPTAAIDAIATVTVAFFESAQNALCLSGAGQESSSSTELAASLAPPYEQVISMALALVTPGVVVDQINVSVVDGVLVVLTADGRDVQAVLGGGNTPTPPGGQVAAIPFFDG